MEYKKRLRFVECSDNAMFGHQVGVCHYVGAAIVVVCYSYRCIKSASDSDFCQLSAQRLAIKWHLRDEGLLE